MIVASNFVLADEAKGIKIRSIDAEIIESAEGDLLKLEGNVIIKTDSVLSFGLIRHFMTEVIKK